MVHKTRLAQRLKASMPATRELSQPLRFQCIWTPCNVKKYPINEQDGMKSFLLHEKVLAGPCRGVYYPHYITTPPPSTQIFSPTYGPDWLWRHAAIAIHDTGMTKVAQLVQVYTKLPTIFENSYWLLCTPALTRWNVKHSTQ